MRTDGSVVLACPYLTVIQKEVAISGGCICLKEIGSMMTYLHRHATF